MRVVVVGASGNVGTSLLEALAAEERVKSILGLARRRPRAEFAKTGWVEANRDGRPRVSLPRRRRRRSSRLAHPALSRPSRSAAHECRWQRARLPRRRGGGRTRAHLRLVGRGLLAGTEGSKRGRELAARRGTDELLRAAQGGGGAGARSLRERASGGEGGAHATRTDLQARGGKRSAATLPRPSAPEPAGPPGADSAPARCPEAPLSGCAFARRRGGLPARCRQ